MTLDEHIYAVKNILNRGSAPQSSRITNRLIEHYIDRTLQSVNVQSICLPMEEANFDDCSDCDIPSLSCKLFKSTISIPNIITSRWNYSGQVRAIDGTLIDPFNLTQNRYKKYSISSKENQGWFIKDNYIYIVGDNHIDLIVFQAIFSDPTKVQELQPCSDAGSSTPCIKGSTTEFPLDDDLVRPLYQLTLEMLGMSQYFKEDKLLNQDDDSQELVNTPRRVYRQSTTEQK